MPGPLETRPPAGQKPVPWPGPDFRPALNIASQGQGVLSVEQLLV